MQIRQLTPKDVTRNVLDVLNSLSSTTELSLYDAKLIVLQQIQHSHNTYVLYNHNFYPVAIGSILISDRLIHIGGRVAHLEDISVLKTVQRLGYGTRIVKFLEEKAIKAGVYKIILNCSEANRPFYEKLGYRVNGYCMRKDISVADI